MPRKRDEQITNILEKTVLFCYTNKSLCALYLCQTYTYWFSISSSQNHISTYSKIIIMVRSWTSYKNISHVWHVLFLIDIFFIGN